LGRVHYLKALKLIHISKTALVNQAQPVWVAVLALIFLQTMPSEKEWVGGIAVIAGSTLLILGRKNVSGGEISR